MFGQWISVDEMLPDLDEKVLVTKRMRFSPDRIENEVMIAWVDEEGRFWKREGFENYHIYDVLAWMPLPMPYKESEDEE